MQKRPLHTFIVHGEGEAAESFKEALEQQQGFKNVHIPALGDAFEV